MKIEEVLINQNLGKVFKDDSCAFHWKVISRNGIIKLVTTEKASDGVFLECPIEAVFSSNWLITIDFKLMN